MAKNAARLGAEIAERAGSGLIPQGATYTITGADWTGPKVCGQCHKAGTKTADGKSWICPRCGIWIGERPKEEPEPKIDVPRPRIGGNGVSQGKPVSDGAHVLKAKGGEALVPAPRTNWNWDEPVSMRRERVVVKLEGAKQ